MKARYNPCVMCQIINGKEYSEQCNKSCEYAMYVQALKAYCFYAEGCRFCVHNEGCNHIRCKRLTPTGYVVDLGPMLLNVNKIMLAAKGDERE